MPSHHAHLLIGSRTWGFSLLPADERAPSLDVSIYDVGTFSIKDARSLAGETSEKPVERPYRTFVIACDAMLHEAQNALLKLFEDPNPDTVFYLIISRDDGLLPTLRSRLNLLGREAAEKSNSAFESFRAASYADRLTLIGEKLTDDDVSWAEAVLRGAEACAEERRDPELIRTVMEISSYFRSPGGSKKMLLEHLALSL